MERRVRVIVVWKVERCGRQIDGGSGIEEEAWACVHVVCAWGNLRDTHRRFSSRRGAGEILELNSAGMRVIRGTRKSRDLRSLQENDWTSNAIANPST